jgi:hypothetical protein
VTLEATRIKSCQIVEAGSLLIFSQQVLHRIPKSRLIEHYRLGHISAKSSSHGAGKLLGHEGDVDYIMAKEVEVGLSLSRKKYDWSEYLISEQQLLS